MKRLLITASITALAFATLGAKELKSGPDFRYPETVIKNATANLSEALEKGDGQATIDGLVQLSIAKSKISADFMPAMINTIDSVAETVTDKPVKSLLYSFEADLYGAVYTNNRWKYDQRSTINDYLPDNIFEWSGKNFRDKVIDLFRKSLSNKTELLAAKHSDYKKVLTDIETGEEYTPTLYDIIAHHAINQVMEMSEIKPFPLREMTGFNKFLSTKTDTDDNSKEFIETTFKSLLDINKNNPAAFIYTETGRLDYFSRNIAYSDSKRYTSLILDLYNKFSDSKYSTDALLKIANSIDDEYSRKIYDLAKRNVEKFGNYPRIAGLKNYIMRYEQQKVTASFTEVSVPSDSIPMQITCRNIGNVTIKAYRIPESKKIDKNIMQQLNGLKLVKSMTFNLDTLKNSTDIKFSPLSSGRYIIVPEFKDKNGKTIKPQYLYENDIIRITNLSILRMEVNNEYRLYVLNATDGKPLAKAALHIVNGKKKDKVTTNKFGYAVIKDLRGIDVYATYGDDRSANEYYYVYEHNRDQHTTKEATVFTDLAVYRPGETVKFAAVVYDNDGKNAKVSKNTTVDITFENANEKEIGKMQLTTDNYGRVDSTFVVPKEGMTGTFTISATEAATNDILASATFVVSEYKAPSFYIEYDKKQSVLAGSDSLCLKGKVMTYSQFPMGGIKVDYQIFPQTGFLYRSNIDNGSDSGHVTTDNEGNWTINISDDIFNGEKAGYFSVRLSATSENGETQTLSTSVGIGDKKYIAIDNDIQIIEASSSSKIDFKVADVTNKAISADCDYVLTTAKGDTIASGTVNSSNPVLDLSKVKSGSYKISLSVKGERSKDDDENYIDLQLYRKTDKIPPLDTPLWVIDNEHKCNADGSYSIRFGNSTDAYIHTIVYNAEGVIKENYTKYGKGMHTISGTAEFAERGYTYITLTTARNHKSYHETIRLIPATPEDSLKIVTETFRDNITPGSKETWKLRLTGNNVTKYTGAVIANMYDASLDAIAPHLWYMSVSYYLSYPFNFTDNYMSSRSVQASQFMKYLKEPSYVLPYINMYGQGFYTIRIRGERVFNAVMTTPQMAGSIDSRSLKESKVESNDFAADESSSLQEVVVVDRGEKVALRDPDIKTAFFMPALVSDDNGVVTIEFDVPNRNTQWAFTALAYTADMKSDIINKVVTSNKPLMVQPNLPRFIRIGDKAVLKASVMNNGKTAISPDVAIELFNPADNKIISATTQKLDIEPNGSKVVTIELNATDGMDYVGYRIKAFNGEYSDGEQSIIAVLPSTTNVVEAEPFYLNEKQQTIELELPKFDKGGKATLEYCDNPVWYCATALPSIISQSQTASAYIGNYYATVIADKIVNGNPTVAEAIKYWNKKNSLKSNLQRNEDLKNISLEDTPWLKEADNETAMMAKLIELTDAATIQYRKQKALISLSELQNSDGGFAWIKGDQSSEYMTWDVLSRFGYLNESGYADTNDALANKIITSAIAYSDKKMIADIEAAKDPKSRYQHYFEYIFIRSMFDSIPTNDKILDIQKEAIAFAKKNWGKYSIDKKAETAIMLANYGETKDAASIVESLRQHARKSESKGYYWDVENTDKVRLAATALKAFYKVNPNDKDIDNIRRWILISKETLKWYNTPSALDAINAVLATGTNWNNSDRKTPEISVGGMKIDSESDDMYLGYIKRIVDIDKADKGELSIKRYGYNPAWGAVYYQYNAPMNEVKKASSSDVKLEKRFYRYDSNGNLESVAASQFKVGDKIQVRISVTTERDLSFVTLTDERPAMFEPKDQLPVYEWKEGACYLRETRDSATNIFFSRLNKGTRIITYDVFVNNSGTFSSGIATLQCQYAPQITAHSAGTTVTAE